MKTSPSALPEWPGEVARLHAHLRAARGAPRERARSDLWRLLVEALSCILRAHARRAGWPGQAEVEDIAGEKALEMVARAESGAWDATDRSSGEIVRYVAHAARNGWLDHQARAGREVPVESDEDFDFIERPAAASGGARVTAEDTVVAREMASALRGCLDRLPQRDRRVWFFRAYYELSSREIAAHPDVRLRAPHVDVVNQRARDALRACMEGKGHELAGLPGAAFVELWDVLEALAPQFVGAREEDGGMRSSR